MKKFKTAFIILVLTIMCALSSVLLVDNMQQSTRTHSSSGGKF